MDTPKVAVFINMDAGYGRDLFLGISRYMRAHEPWIIYGAPSQIAIPILDLGTWPGNGIIAQVWSPGFREMLQDACLPVVNVSQHEEEADFPSALSDCSQSGGLVARYFMERGFSNFAFCGYTGHYYSQLRGDAFCHQVEAAGHPCARLDTEVLPGIPELWHEGLVQLEEWVRELPKPIAIMACNDVRARHLATACFHQGLRVPEDVSLVGVDNDLLVCEVSNPSLSSVDVSAEQVGYEAAALLDQIMKRGVAPHPELSLKVPPRGIVERRSSDMLAITDPEVVKAMRYIRRHSAEALSVDDVVAAVPLSRRVLERRFRDHLKQSIYEFICNTRIEQAKSILLHTDAPICEIAERSGFEYLQQFNSMFKRLTGVTPKEYRRKYLSTLPRT